MLRTSRHLGAGRVDVPADEFAQYAGPVFARLLRLDAERLPVFGLDASNAAEGVLVLVDHGLEYGRVVDHLAIGVPY